jgi:hypothetical protein
MYAESSKRYESPFHTNSLAAFLEEVAIVVVFDIEITRVTKLEVLHNP